MWGMDDTITFEAFAADGTRLVVNTWKTSERRALAAYRMRWLRRGKTVRITEPDGSVTAMSDFRCYLRHGERGKVVLHAVFDVPDADAAKAQAESETGLRCFAVQVPREGWSHFGLDTGADGAILST